MASKSTNAGPSLSSCKMQVYSHVHRIKCSNFQNAGGPLPFLRLVYSVSSVSLHCICSSRRHHVLQGAAAAGLNVLPGVVDLILAVPDIIPRGGLSRQKGGD
jgi:hypothetical protein